MCILKCSKYTEVYQRPSFRNLLHPPQQDSKSRKSKELLFFFLLKFLCLRLLRQHDEVLALFFCLALRFFFLPQRCRFYIDSLEIFQTGLHHLLEKTTFYRTSRYFCLDVPTQDPAKQNRSSSLPRF